MQMEKQSYYMVIPAEVWESNLTAKAMILYGHISVLANNKKYCWASNDYFVKAMKMPQRTLLRCFTELEESGFIFRQLIYVPGTTQVQERRIYLNVKAGAKYSTRPGVKNGYRPGVTDGKDNSTSI
jgi:hypothetical protein